MENSKEKFFKFLLSVIIISCVENAQAQYVFSSPTETLHVIPFGDDNKTAAASLEVEIGACSGRISGIGSVTTKTLVFTPYEKAEKGEACTVKVDFDVGWKHARVTEAKNCVVYHGASCEWNSSVVMK